ncbi:MAG: hypothetical protein NC924_08020 [Candidatus Omnitrophica bacterium]|nr:hypothetical protein [Candidatus Omnitrophota bacterium]
MSDKLEQLTKQIYEEGVQKAQEEAKKIVAAAEEEKRKILRQAREEAEEMRAAAAREAEELRRRVESELRMAGQQVLALLRQKITEMISVKVAEQGAKNFVGDPNFLKNVLEVVMKEWISSGCQHGQEFYLKLPHALRQDLETYFLQHAQQELGAGLRVEFDEKIKSGFVIVPKDGGYRIGFTEDDFKALILYFLRPRLIEFLFQ